MNDNVVSKARALATCGGLTAGSLFCSAVIWSSVNTLAYNTEISSGVRQSLSGIAPIFISQMGLALVGSAYVLWSPLSLSFSVRPLNASLRDAMFRTVVLVAVACSLTALLRYVTVPHGEYENLIVSGLTERELTVALLSVPLVSLLEEFYFRGVLQTRLRRTFSPFAAITLSNTLFVFLHIVGTPRGGPGVLLRFAVLFGIGSAYGYLYERTETLFWPSLMHTAYNLQSFVLFGVV